MRKKTKLVLLIPVFALILSLIAVDASAADCKYREYYNNTAELFSSQNPPTVGTAGGEWEIVGLARSGYNHNDSYFEEYYANVVNKVRSQKGVLSKNKYTEYSRVVLALTSLGKSVTDVGGYNLLAYLGDYNKVAYQGINGVAWALIALDSNNYEIPQNTSAAVQTTRELLIDKILDLQLSGGGWALSGTTPDPDITAAAITALSPYGKRDDVRSANDKGVAVLSRLQNSNGGMSSMGGANSESVAQVIVCLTALGIDPDNDGRFIKNGNSLVDALLTYSLPGGGFSHSPNGGYNQIASEQGFYALVAYDRFLEGRTHLFNMTDVIKDYNSYTELTSSSDYIYRETQTGAASQEFYISSITTANSRFKKGVSGDDEESASAADTQVASAEEVNTGAVVAGYNNDNKISQGTTCIETEKEVLTPKNSLPSKPRDDKKIKMISHTQGEYIQSEDRASVNTEKTDVSETTPIYEGYGDVIRNMLLILLCGCITAASFAVIMKIKISVR